MRHLPLIELMTLLVIGLCGYILYDQLAELVYARAAEVHTIADLVN